MPNTVYCSHAETVATTAEYSCRICGKSWPEDAPAPAVPIGRIEPALTPAQLEAAARFINPDGSLRQDALPKAENPK